MLVKECSRNNSSICYEGRGAQDSTPRSQEFRLNYRYRNYFAHNSKRTQPGISLIELLIALLINVVLLAALINVVSMAVGHQNKSTMQNQLTNELQAVMEMIANDVRRAGYWANARNDLGTGNNTNPFMANGTELTLNTDHNCMLFTYDASKNGVLPAISSAIDDDRYGYRLINFALQSRPPGATFACTAATTNWENLTDPTRIKITNFSLTLNQYIVPSSSTGAQIAIRSLDISLTGQLTSDAAITKTLTQHIRIRNDKLLS